MSKRTQIASAVISMCVVLSLYLWMRVPTAPYPEMFTGETVGCGMFAVYRYDKSCTYCLNVFCDEFEILLKQGIDNHVSIMSDLYSNTDERRLRILDVGDETTVPSKEYGQNRHVLVPVDVKIIRFSQPAPDYFCNDVYNEARPIQTWTALSGDLTIRIRDVEKESFAVRHVAVTLNNIVLEEVVSKKRLTIEHLELPETLIGHRPHPTSVPVKAVIPDDANANRVGSGCCVY